MKRSIYILYFLILFLSTGLIHAQNDRDRMEALRVSFISKRLDLTVSESEKFWPVYNEYTDKIKAVKKNLRQSYKKKQGELSESEAEGLYQLELQSRQAEADIYRQYSERIKDLIGVKKTVRLRVAEEDFKHEILVLLKEKND